MILKHEIHRKDLEYLLNSERVDMSPEAISARLEEVGRLCELSRKINVPYIYRYSIGQEKILGCPPPTGETLS